MNGRYWKKLVAPSTFTFFREGRRTPGYSFYDWLHGYVYGRWPYLYIGLGKGEHRFSKPLSRVVRVYTRLFPPPPKPAPSTASLEPDSDGIRASGTHADGYHGKVVPLKAAEQLVLVGENVQLTNLEKIIPYPRARDIILKNPDHILALECPCRSSVENPCLPLDVCMIVGEPFASFVSEHHPDRSRRITQEEAVEILRAENERGHVHHAFFKDAMLGRFYAICNCCACCCGAMHSHQHGTPMLSSSGYVSQVEEDLCIACGDCVEFCQFGAIETGTYAAQVDEALCMGCGICVDHCDQGALSLCRQVSKGEPLEINALLQMAALEP